MSNKTQTLQALLNGLEIRLPSYAWIRLMMIAERENRTLEQITATLLLDYVENN